jgi:enhancer of mRNA-decapping protein 3
MLVTLSDPPGAQLRGVVSGIEPGKSLTLRNGMAYLLFFHGLC